MLLSSGVPGLTGGPAQGRGWPRLGSSSLPAAPGKPPPHLCIPPRHATPPRPSRHHHGTRLRPSALPLPLNNRPQVPKRIVIVGGGYIAVEFAGIFAGLGSEVHLVYRQDRPLRGFDDEVGSLAVVVCAHVVVALVGRGGDLAQRRGGGGQAAVGTACPALQPVGLSAAAAQRLPPRHATPHSRQGCRPPCPLPLRVQVRTFAAEQYAQNGLHLHPLTVPQQLVKLPDGRLKFTGARRTGAQVRRSRSGGVTNWARLGGGGRLSCMRMRRLVPPPWFHARCSACTPPAANPHRAVASPAALSCPALPACHPAVVG